MKIYYDTGVLLKLYTEEPESAAVRAFVIEAGEALPFLGLHQSECSSALHLKAFRGECSIEQANQALGDIDEDLRSGVLEQMRPEWESLWEKTFELTQAHSSITGCRTLDTLHIAATLHLGFRHLATSDQRQSSLARRVGLRVFDPTTPRRPKGPL